MSWADAKLEKACSGDKLGQRRWGADHWKMLKRRLASLAAAPTLKDMSNLPGGCHALGQDRAGTFAVSLWGPFRMVFEPDHDPVPRLPDGGVDRSQITRISIKEVTDYHGD